MKWILVVGLGAGLGVVTGAVDSHAGGLGESNLWRLASGLLNAGVTWAGLAVLCGRLFRRAAPAMLAGSVGLLTAVLAYYLFGALLGDRVGVDVGNLLAALRFWLVGGVVAGPLLGLAGALSHRRDVVGLIAALTVPVGALVEMFGLRRFGPGVFAEDVTVGVAQTLIVLAGVVGVGAVLRSRNRSSHEAAAHV